MRSLSEIQRIEKNTMEKKIERREKYKERKYGKQINN